MNKSSGPVSLYDERLQELLDYGGLTLNQELEQLKLLEESVVDKDNVEQDIFNNFDTNDLYDQFFTQKKKKYESIRLYLFGDFNFAIGFIHFDTAYIAVY